MTRRLPLAPLFFLALWCAWFALPSTRPYAKSDWKRVWSPPDPDKPPQLQTGESRDALVAMASSGNHREEAFRQLEHQFPQDAAIYAGQLTHSVSGLKLQSVRQGGPASHRDPNWSVRLSKIERPSPAFLARWFAACARGAQLEPNNTFWDWMRIIGLLAARRNQSVWPILHSARFKTGYDDHSSDLRAARVREERRQFGVPSTFDELKATFAYPSSTYDQMEETGRQLRENAWGLRLQNTPASHNAGLEGMRDLVFLCRTLGRENKTYNGSTTAQQFEVDALWGGSSTPTNGRFVPLSVGLPLSVYASDRRSLVLWARQRGRADIAAQISREYVDFGKWRKNFSARGVFNFVTEESVDERDLTLATLSDWWRWPLLTGMPLALGLVALVSLPLHLVPALRRERDIALSRASWAWGAAIGFWSVALLCSALLWNIAATLRAHGATLSNVILWMSWKPTSHTSPYSEAPRVWQLAFPAALLWIGALWSGAGWDAREYGEPSLIARLRTLSEAPDDGFARFDVSPLVALILRISAISMATLSVLAFLVVPTLNKTWGVLWDYAEVAFLLFAFFVGVPAVRRIESVRGRAFALLLARRFAWSFLLCSTLVWGALTLATIPAHKRFEAQIDRYLRIGEFQLARRRLGF